MLVAFGKIGTMPEAVSDRVSARYAVGQSGFAVQIILGNCWHYGLIAHLLLLPLYYKLANLHQSTRTCR